MLPPGKGPHPTLRVGGGAARPEPAAHRPHLAPSLVSMRPGYQGTGAAGSHVSSRAPTWVPVITAPLDEQGKNEPGGLSTGLRWLHGKTTPTGSAASKRFYGGSGSPAADTDHTPPACESCSVGTRGCTPVWPVPSPSSGSSMWWTRMVDRGRAGGGRRLVTPQPRGTWHLCTRSTWRNESRRC